MTAIRPGSHAGSEAASVEGGARREPGGAVPLWVAATGVGMAETAAEGNGLANLRERLRAFYGEAARIELTEQAPHGLRADIFLPLTPATPQR